MQLEDFWNNVNVLEDKDECWEWTRAKTEEGYGTVFIGKCQIYAHVIAYFIGNGYRFVKVNKAHICHKCNNPSCCNPRHLYHGSAKSNMEDKRFRFQMEQFMRNYGNNSPFVGKVAYYGWLSQFENTRV